MRPSGNNCVKREFAGRDLEAFWRNNYWRFGIGDSFWENCYFEKNTNYSLVVSLFQRFLKKQFDQIGFESQVVHLAFRNLDPQVLFVSRRPKLQLRNEWLMVGITQTLNHEFLKNGQVTCVNARSCV